ncbi:DeoR/GlpR family DNA-binding transcription regulator [Calycomorphotria hydatis]|uniref:Glucitol operon repressor n=1 Tax=Calycomorphotria hydatis TaxID=2528027 RepID=A0A517T3I6_9PLAN|nr:DeoR/GlpR family DNA-binding transcription regulator [Calycomorphotria hydatis]QDT62901.1 Glucitol operon repressor [Calycomorphotria hydatis]
MLLDDRRQKILDSIEQRGSISLSELMMIVEVSESTLRRDLDYLDRIGQIRRTRGGATYVGESLPAFDSRTTLALEQKRNIAEATVALVEPGDTLLLEGGTTTLEVARLLKDIPLQVVTNSLPIAQLLSGRPDIELLLVGGYVYPKTGVAIGPMALASIKGLRVNRLIMGVDGLTEEGLFSSNALLVETERGFLDSADEVVVVTHSGKFGRPSLTHLCVLGAVQRIVTDSGIAPEWKKVLEKHSIKLTIAPGAPYGSGRESQAS